jgi:hypothetical protein
VRAIVAIGPTARIDLDYGGRPLEVVLDRNRLHALDLSVGDWCAVRFHRIRVFADATPALPVPAAIIDGESRVVGVDAAPQAANGSGGHQTAAMPLPDLESVTMGRPSPRARARANGSGI